MVVRIKGAPRQGVWFSADVRFLDLTVTNGDFVNDLTIVTTDPRQADVVNSTLEVVIEAVATRGTVIGVTVEDATHVNLMVDYAQAYDPDSVVLGNQDAIGVIAEVTALIDAHDGTGDSPADLTASAFTVESGFAQFALVTPT